MRGKGFAFAAAAVTSLLCGRLHAEDGCAQEMEDAERMHTAPTFIRAAECLQSQHRVSDALQWYARARGFASADLISLIEERMASLRSDAPGVAANAAFDQAMKQLEANGSDREAARRYAAIARDLATTPEEIKRVKDLADEILRGVPSFSLDVSFKTSVLGFIGSGSSITPDRFFNTKNALLYSVQPIVLGGFSAQARFLDTRGWEKYGLRIGYETDRIFGGGGTITNSTLAQQLGVNGVAADIVNGALALSGVGFEGEHATFTNGRVRRIDVPSNTRADEAPLKFSRTRLEGTFDLTRFITKDDDKPRLDTQRWQVGLNALYYQVALPRIAYLTQRDTSNQTIVVAESEPQSIDVGFGAGGATGRLATGGDWGSIGAFLTLMIGGGQVAFNMPARVAEPAGPNNRTHLREPTVAVVSRAGIYGDVHLAGDTYAAFMGASLNGEQYYAEAHVPGTVEGSVGFADAFYTALLTVTVRYRYLPGH